MIRPRASWIPVALAAALAVGAIAVYQQISGCQSELEQLVSLDRAIDDIALLAAADREGWQREVAHRLEGLQVAIRALDPSQEAGVSVTVDQLETIAGQSSAARAFDRLRRLIDSLHVAIRDRLAADSMRLDSLLGGFAWTVGGLAALALLAGIATPRLRARARVQADVLRQNGLLAAAVRSADEGIMVSTFGDADEPSRIEFVNASFARMCGCEAAELIGQPVSEVEACRAGEEGTGDVGRSISDGRSTRLETAVDRPDGSREYWEWHLSPVRSRGGTITHFVSSLRDITRRRHYEEELRRTADALQQANRQLRENHAQLVQSEKMASLGQLAAGVAHEINNPIGYVRANVDTLAQDLQAIRHLIGRLQAIAVAVAGGDSEAAQRAVDAADEVADRDNVPALLEDLDPMLSDIREGLDRIHEIVSGLRDFARPADTQPEPTDVNHQLESALKITRNALKYHFEIVTKLGELPVIVSQPGQLIQVFTNLLVNAADAIDEHGTITITSEADETWVTIRMADTGCGIEARHLAEIFSPFFTTKPAGQGTGLGLAVSYGIVTRLGGTISVASSVGEGSTFTVKLPRT